jgi:hypothetical protein
MTNIVEHVRIYNRKVVIHLSVDFLTIQNFPEDDAETLVRPVGNGVLSPT